MELLQFKPTNEHSFIKITIILQTTNSYMFRALLAHHQGAHSSTHKIVHFLFGIVITDL